MNKATLKKLEATFKEMESSKGKVGLELLEKAIFIDNTLERLKEEINTSEVINLMSQGSYNVERINPAIKTYNTTVTNYQKIMKQITDLLPKEKTKEELQLEKEWNDFENF